MRLILGLLSLAGSIYLVREALNIPSNESIGKLLGSLPLMILSYLLLRKILFAPLELLGFSFFLGGKTIVKDDNRFKEVQENINKGKLKDALQDLDIILKKYPKFKQAQVRKIQLLANNFYDIEKALNYSKEVLNAGKFNRNRMEILILISAMLRKQGHTTQALSLIEIYKNKSRGKLRTLIERMEESWASASRSY
jgi:hypothetical protein